MAGSEVAASDLYGTGVRVGMYLQVLAMLLCCIRHKYSGIKLASSATCLALLGAWSVVTKSQNNSSEKIISPVEAWIILCLVGTMWFPALAIFLDYESETIGEGVATCAIVVAMLWHSGAMLAFWRGSCLTLPSLDTKDRAFLFGKINIKADWLNELMFAVGISDVFTGFVIALVLLRLEWDTAKTWFQGKEKLDTNTADANLCRSQKVAKYAHVRYKRITVALVGVLVWILTIVNVELTLQWNELQPTTDTSLPGQAIFLVIGVVMVFDAIVGLLQPRRTRDSKTETEHGSNAATASVAPKQA